jgi:replicative superfamily II helicase
MPEVIKIKDNLSLVPTSDYPYAKWDFPHFNQVQSRLFETYDKSANVAVASSTSSGKTVSAEMYMAHTIRKIGGKAIYIGPLKALASEKHQDWTDPNHHFSDLKIAVATGDFRFTANRIKEIEDSDIIVMTPEMLASRTRSHNSEKSRFLFEVNCATFDESHLLGVPSRGDHIEVALMKLAEINPDMRIVLLSATMPNVDEICGWISSLTNRDTYYLESEYRPCPLNVHYESYYDGDRIYWDKEAQKIGTACAIVEYYPDDKFLVFVHTIETGHTMLKALSRMGIEAEFHNGTKDAKTRNKIEDRFKNDKSMRVMVATSTVAWGCNLPARRVIIVGVHRGLTEVENYDLWQMVGRSGRPKFDPAGDAYILVPESEKDHWIRKIKKKLPIRSTLLSYVGKEDNPHYKTLAFHIVAEIHQGNVKTKEGFRNWFRKSLAYHQEQAFDDVLIDRTIEQLKDCRAVNITPEGEYECTAIGKVASMFYYSPFDVSELRRNFKFLFDEKKEGDDYCVSIALGNIDSYRWSICNKFEREAISQYTGKIDLMFGQGKFTAGALKHSAAIYYLLKGRRDIPQIATLQNMLVSDMDRTIQVLHAIDTMSAKWEKQAWFKNLGMRIRYGVESDLVELCQIPNVGQVRAKRLKAKKIKTLDAFVAQTVESLATIMKVSKKMAEECLEAAKLIQLKEAL